MDMQNNSRAAELRLYLKSRMSSMPYRGLIRDIYVSEDKDGKSLDVSIIPNCDVVAFGTINIGLAGVDTDSKWRRKQKDIYGKVKGCCPKVSPSLSERILREAGEKLEIWRIEHPFSEELTEFLESDTASANLFYNKIDTLRFLAGNEPLSCAGTEVKEGAIAVPFKEVPFKAVYETASGRLRFSLSEADTLYKKLVDARKYSAIQREIEAYLIDSGRQASVRYTGRPGEFSISFRFEGGEESEQVTVGNTYKKIVSDAYRTARERAARKKKEREEHLKSCPCYGTFVAQAVIDTIEDNGRVTAAQIVSILRGTDLTNELVFGKYTGKYNMLQKSEISDTITDLEQFGIIRSHNVHGWYRNYYVYSVTRNGRLFSELQNRPGPGKRPVTEQENLLALKAVREEIGKLPRRNKLEFLETITERPGIFLTDPELVLDCVERMGSPAQEFLKGCYAKEERRNRRNILRLLLNAAAGKGKVLPRNGLTVFREREEKKRREMEESARKEQELFRLVLTEIPDNYVDLYPAARSMKRHFVLHIGPTNSGKTHDAIEELIHADNGIYLAPLRLLAFELYERMNRGECPCSLVTGEEQFIIDGARHQSSTIEMLNVGQRYDVAVIDEAQMIADSERGGAWATAIMGVCASRVHVCAAPEAEKRIIEIIRDCGDDYEIVRHRRMTPLVYEEKPFRFPEDVRAGDALIVFSRRNVHAVAAQLRKRKVECSIIYGALPYDVRHRQAELFASGAAKVVVATDAIGMGMNLPIRRVVLMETRKFDGTARRPLRGDEIRQIVGRAGRYGIYDTGYAVAANGDETVKRAMEDRFYPIGKAVIDFPETLLTVDASILDLIRKWEEVVPAEGWQKESIEQMRRLAEMTQGLNAPKRLAYDFLTIPFEDDNGELLDIWQNIFVKEVRGEEYSIYDLVDSMELKKPSKANAIDMLEQQHRVLDLYFNLARKFQPLESTLDLIMEKKRACSERIMKVLETCGFKEKRCKSCGKALPWNHPYGLCTKCYEKQRGMYYRR